MDLAKASDDGTVSEGVLVCVCVCVWTKRVCAAGAPPAAGSYLSSPIWPPGQQTEEAPDLPR